MLMHRSRPPSPLPFLLFSTIPLSPSPYIKLQKGTMPAVFGQAMAAFVLCELAEQVRVHVAFI